MIVEGLVLVAFVCACGTTVITPQPGHEWCMEVQGPLGSVSEPNSLDQQITEPDTFMEPRGCLCVTEAEEHLLREGRHAEQLDLPLPEGYQPLRDELGDAARVRCTQLALEHEPPLMYTNCLSADVSSPFPGDGVACTICLETEVWSGNQEEVECPPGLEEATASVPGTSTTDAESTGAASLDETGASDGSGFGLFDR